MSDVEISFAFVETEADVQFSHTFGVAKHLADRHDLIVDVIKWVIRSLGLQRWEVLLSEWNVYFQMIIRGGC